MVEPTRSEVYVKLETLVGMSKSAMFMEMSTWAQEVSLHPEKITDDLESYDIYHKAE